MSDFKLDHSALAPIVIFAYKRPDKFEKLLDSLKQCYESKHSSLYIFLDKPNSELLDKAHFRMKEIISEIDGFDEVVVSLSDKHLGLSQNITQGISKVLELNDRIIVLEEDLVVSSNFLYYMNCALQIYDNSLEVFHIAAHCDSVHRLYGDDFFFTRKMDCWGWATWKNRWSSFTKNPEELLKHASAETVKAFNFDGIYQLWDQVEKNASGQLDTWAIFWQATINSQSGLCLTPNKPFAINTGQDGSGHHGIWSKETKKLNNNFSHNSLPKTIFDSTSLVIRNFRTLSAKNGSRKRITEYFFRLSIGIRKRIKGIYT
jgi:hypothetical protein